MTEETIWHKFHPIYRNLLKVGLERTFPKGAVLNLDPLYETSNLIHDSSKETIIRVCEPSIKVIGSNNGKVVQVFFNPTLSVDPLFRRFVFFRKIQKYSWMAAARFGERLCFGFNAEDSQNEQYLPLVYYDGEFRPVYFRIQGRESNGIKKYVVYLEVCAWDEDQMVVVQARRVEVKDVPKHLLP